MWDCANTPPLFFLSGVGQKLLVKEGYHFRIFFLKVLCAIKVPHITRLKDAVNIIFSRLYFEPCFQPELKLGVSEIAGLIAGLLVVEINLTDYGSACPFRM